MLTSDENASLACKKAITFVYFYNFFLFIETINQTVTMIHRQKKIETDILFPFVELL